MLASAMVMAFMLAMSVTAFAGADGTISVSPVYAVGGSEFTVTLNLDSPGILNIGLIVEWDPAKMEMLPNGLTVDRTLGFAALLQPQATAIAAGSIRFNMEGESMDENIATTGSIPLGTMRFRLLDGANLGDAIPLTLTVNPAASGKVIDGDLVDVVLTVPASVTVTCAHWWPVGWNYYSAEAADRDFIALIAPAGTVYADGRPASTGENYAFFEFLLRPGGLWDTVCGMFGETRETMSLNAAFWYYENIMIPAAA